MFSDINAIWVGYRGRQDLLKQIFGSSDDDKKRPIKDVHGEPVILTPHLFDQFMQPKKAN